MGDSVAIVGIAARVPGAGSATDFWRNLRDGVCSIDAVPDEELLEAAVSRAALADPDYVKVAAAAPDLDRFDAPLFGMSPREARLCDPQLRLFLETAHAAMVDAGHAPGDLLDVGVFASSATSDYAYHVRQVEAIDPRSAEGMALASWNSPDSVASLVSYKLDLRGPSVGVVSACSSSLVAVHLAARAILAGDCDLALAGGADVSVPVRSGHWWGPGGPLSRTGTCRPFDADADGTVFASGGAAVLLRRTEDALADGDHVYAVIDASVVNSDGAAKVGFSAPGVAGQAAVVAEALSLAEVDPAQIGFVEGHATATALGDPIEVEALTRAFRALGDTRVGECVLGSVKGNIGHLGHASGVASLVKTALVLRHGELPGTVGFVRPNPGLRLERTPFRVTASTQPWSVADGGVRRASLSSFGFGGTNAHLVLSAPPLRPEPTDSGRPRLVVWSARTPSARTRAGAALAEHLAQEGAGLDATAVTLARGREAYPARAAAVGSAAAELSGRVTTREGVAEGVVRDRPTVCFLYPGQGSQHPRMAAGLAAAYPAFGEALDRCLDGFTAHGIDLRPLLGDVPAESLLPTLVAQPLLFAVEYAVTELWASVGVVPDVVLGHSLGELVGATTAGVLSPEDAVGLVAARARAMSEMPPGGLLAVSAALTEVEALLPPSLAVAIHNGPRQVIVGGSPDDLAAFAARCCEVGVRTTVLRTAHAFHTPAGRGAREAFMAAVREVPFAAPERVVYSASHGGRVGADLLREPGFWGRQLSEPVRFADALETLRAEVSGPLVLLEAGPGRALTGLVGVGLADAEGTHTVVPSLPAAPADPDAVEASFLRAVGAAWVEGVQVDLRRLFPDSDLRRVPLPGYPYERQRFWVDGTPAPADPPTRRSADPGEPDEPGSTDEGTEEVDVAELLARRFAGALGRPAAHDDEDFFEAGGDSLAAVGLLAKLRRDLGVDLDLDTFVDDPTIAGLARGLSDPPAPTDDTPVDHSSGRTS